GGLVLELVDAAGELVDVEHALDRRQCVLKICQVCGNVGLHGHQGYPPPVRRSAPRRRGGADAPGRRAVRGVTVRSWPCTPPTWTSRCAWPTAPTRSPANASAPPTCV